MIFISRAAMKLKATYTVPRFSNLLCRISHCIAFGSSSAFILWMFFTHNCSNILCQSLSMIRTPKPLTCWNGFPFGIIIRPGFGEFVAYILRPFAFMPSINQRRPAVSLGNRFELISALSLSEECHIGSNEIKKKFACWCTVNEFIVII
jgi:hypothetical protein